MEKMGGKAIKIMVIDDRAKVKADISAQLKTEGIPEEIVEFIGDLSTTDEKLIDSEGNMVIKGHGIAYKVYIQIKADPLIEEKLHVAGFVVSKTFNITEADETRTLREPIKEERCENQIVSQQEAGYIAGRKTEYEKVCVDVVVGYKETPVLKDGYKKA